MSVLMLLFDTYVWSWYFKLYTGVWFSNSNGEKSGFMNVLLLSLEWYQNNKWYNNTMYKLFKQHERTVYYVIFCLT